MLKNLIYVSGIGFILLLTVLVPIGQTAATKSSAYDSGYDHGCKDAGNGDQYINTPGKGASFHTAEFMRGYDDGHSACSRQDGGNFQRPGPPQQQPGGSGTIEDLCNQYHDQLGLNKPCSAYVNGNHLRGPGAFFIVCNLIRLGVTTTGPLGALLLAIPCG